MRIAILGSVALPVPPPFQGGTEWIAYYQADGLAALGHQVFLFGARGSAKGNYELVETEGGNTVVGSAALKSLKGDAFESSRRLRLENIYLAQVMQKLIDRKDDYDLILNNMRGEAIFLPVAKFLGKPFVNVMHLPLFPEMASIFKTYNTPVITISNAQRRNFPDLNYLATVYNCVDTEKFAFNPAPKDYLLMVGSITPHKNQAGAIRVAKRLGLKLILAGKVNDQKYFESLQPDIDGEKIRWIGEIGMEEKVKLYQEALTFLFPILWEEPFGLVMIEAMSCGTPVVAFNNGAISEVVVDGKCGFVIENDSEEEMAKAIAKIDAIKRENCRKHVEENFTLKKMVEGYEEAIMNLQGNAFQI